MKAAIGEDIDNETLGGAQTHDEISGVTDYRCANEEEALAHIRKLASHWGDLGPKAGFQGLRLVAGIPVHLRVVPDARTDPTTHATFSTPLWTRQFTEYKSGYGKTLCVGMRASTDGVWALWPTNARW